MTHRELAEMIFKNKSIMNGYEPNATDDELIDYYAMLIEDYAKQKLSIASIGSKRPTDQEILQVLNLAQCELREQLKMNKYAGSTALFAVDNLYEVLKATCDSYKGGEANNAGGHDKQSSSGYQTFVCGHPCDDY